MLAKLAGAGILGLAALMSATPRPVVSSVPGQFVGIEYWLQDKAGARLTEHRIAPGVRYTLHIKSNSAGFLGVWTTLDGERLTADYEGYPGHRLEAHTSYRVPGDFRKSSSASEGSVVVLFSRSQTEQVRTAEQALQKLGRLRPYLFSEPGAKVSTFVYHREGGQPSVEIPVTR